VFNGVAPTIAIEKTAADEAALVAAWLQSRATEGLRPHEMAVFVRSEAELPRAKAAADRAGIPFVILDDRMETRHDRLSITTMHLAKGLEFRAVVVMACDDDVIPQQERIATVADESDLDEVYQTERHLLYVACTRARDQLLVTGVEPGSEFLEDMGAGLATRRRP
jgi:superfamily I DNA/RNA helicase